MFRPLLRTAFTALAALAFASSSYASTISYTSTFDPAAVLMNSSGGTCTGTNYEDSTTDTVSGQSGGSCLSLAFSHELVGYSNPPDALQSATLTLYFHDDGDPSNTDSSGNPESVTILLDQGLLTQLSIGEVLLTNNGSSTLPYDVFAQVSPDGLLSVLLGVGPSGFGQNDFYFDKSELSAEWLTDGAQNIPEPASLLLVGSGLGAAVMRFRRRSAPRA